MQVTATIFEVYSFRKLQWDRGLGALFIVFFVVFFLHEGNYVINKQGIEELALRMLFEKKIFMF